jgi:inner membrane protein
MVVDPWFTLPLLAAAAYSLARRQHFQRAFLLATAASGVYLALRIVVTHHLTKSVQAAYPETASVQVFPAPLSLTSLRYVATDGTSHAAGGVALGSPPREDARVSALPDGPLPASLRAVPTVREALSWARFPVVRLTREGDQHRVAIADLRYHLRGEPTLTFVIVVGDDGSVRQALLERGGSFGQLFARFRGAAL